MSKKLRTPCPLCGTNPHDPTWAVLEKKRPAQELKKNIRRYRKAGWSLREIGRILKVSHEQVRLLLRDETKLEGN